MVLRSALKQSSQRHSDSLRFRYVRKGVRRVSKTRVIMSVSHLVIVSEIATWIKQLTFEKPFAQRMLVCEAGAYCSSWQGFIGYQPMLFHPHRLREREGLGTSKHSWLQYRSGLLTSYCTNQPYAHPRPEWLSQILCIYS
jgi:hypothetical protein